MTDDQPVSADAKVNLAAALYAACRERDDARARAAALEEQVSRVEAFLARWESAPSPSPTLSRSTRELRAALDGGAA